MTSRVQDRCFSGMIEPMRTPPPVNLPEGGTPAERLDIAFCKVLTVSKADILKAEGREKWTRQRSGPRKRRIDGAALRPVTVVL
jgi:hypothetical protein